MDEPEKSDLKHEKGSLCKRIATGLEGFGDCHVVNCLWRGHGHMKKLCRQPLGVESSQLTASKVMGTLALQS